MFPYRELFAVGNFSMHVITGTAAVWGKLDIDLVDTDLNSLWPSLEPDDLNSLAWRSWPLLYL